MATSTINTAQRTIKLLFNSSNYAKYSIVSVRKHSVWTQDNIVKSPYKSVEIPSCSLYEYVWQNLDKWPKKTLSVCANTGRSYTYERGYMLSKTFAANLRKKFKIRDGDTVAVMLPNVPEFPMVAMGILEAGGVVSTINPIYTAHEVQRQLLMSDSKLIVTLAENVNTVQEALKIAKLNIKIIVVKIDRGALPDGTISFNELSEDVSVDRSCLKEVKRNSNDICFLPYSSGTTGLPKGVELSHFNLIANCEQINDPLVRCHQETTASHQDKVMAILPYFHIYAATVIMFHKMAHGIQLVSLPKFQPEAFLEALVKYKTNVIFVAPPLVIMMATHPASSAKTLQYLEIVINGAAPLAASDADRFFSKVGHKMRFGQGYGLTETSPVVSITAAASKNYGSVGCIVANTEVKVIDSEFNALGPNTKGELIVRGPQVMKGYKNNPEANTEVFTDDGFFRTGDMAEIDHTGEITITDRLKELIKVKGFQVPPAELEAVLREHPAINDAAVIGVPHPAKGESPKAFVVLKNGSKVSTKEIQDFIDTRVAAYKRVDDIVLIDAIPKSSAGKILRRVLKEKYC
ncbi:uncharacterized protein [Epargyreus clarus]|uniref:uncharacterized protein n=1 Tax=Epargyreus clarus TaxID=520877 RepID=UPI003C2AC475